MERIKTIGIIGLGKIGQAVAYRLLQAGYTVYGYDLDKAAVDQAKQMGVCSAATIVELGTCVDIVWIAVPAGKPVDSVVEGMKVAKPYCNIVIDSGNSNFKYSIQRAQELKKYGVNFLDCGTSGGLYGKENGFCLMVGGDRHAYEHVKIVLQHIAAPNGCAHVGPSGAGHYVKMVHNGIEYALLQSYAEGFHVLKTAPFDQLNLEQIAELWNHGSVIRSWILQLLVEVLKKDLNFEEISGYIAEGGTGQWTVNQAQKQGVPVNLIKEALQIRYASQESGGNFATKLVALLRLQFGGHPIKKNETKSI